MHKCKIISTLFVSEQLSFPVRYRLPAELLPESYNITLWPRLRPHPLTGLYVFTGDSQAALGVDSIHRRMKVSASSGSSILSELISQLSWIQSHSHEMNPALFLCRSGKSIVTFECVAETDLLLIHSNKLNYTELEDTHIARISHSGTHTASFTRQPDASLTSGCFVSQVGGFFPSSPPGCSHRRSIWFSSSTVN